MYGAISGQFMLELAHKMGMYAQPELEGLHTPQWFFIKPEYLCRVRDELTYFNPKGQPYGISGDVDHPSFTRLREHLGSKGLIKIERSWTNGDRVLKSFYLNNYLMLPGDKFSSAGAMHYTLSRHGNYNDGQIDLTVKNYRD